MSEVKEKYRVKRKRESWPIGVSGDGSVSVGGNGFSTVGEAVSWAQGNCPPGEYTLYRICPQKLVVSEEKRKTARLVRSTHKSGVAQE